MEEQFNFCVWVESDRQRRFVINACLIALNHSDKGLRDISHFENMSISWGVFIGIDSEGGVRAATTPENFGLKDGITFDRFVTSDLYDRITWKMIRENRDIGHQLSLCHNQHSAAPKPGMIVRQVQSMLVAGAVRKLPRALRSLISGGRL